MTFRIELEPFRGPVDLLLYLVRKGEVDVTEVSLGKIADQFLEYLEVLQELNVDDVGDFVEMASTLLEIKSRNLLPRCDEVEEELEDPREGLVERLLEYKKFKDAASLLEDLSREWQQRYPRQTNDVPPRKLDVSKQPIHEVELWDLVSALGRVMKENQPPQPANIVYDETPIHVYMSRIHNKLGQIGRAALSDLFQPGMHKSAMIGVFLAVLELVRHHSVDAEQVDPSGEIWIVPGNSFTSQAEFETADNYLAGKPNHQDLPVKPR